MVQYRNRILPLVPLRDVLEGGSPRADLSPGQGGDPIQVVVFNDGERSVGLVVDQILDVAEEAVTVRQKSARKGLLGSAVVGKRVTDFLDLGVGSAAAGDCSRVYRAARGKRILVAEPSAFSRSLIRSSLDMEGYQVVEAANLDQAIRRLEQTAVDVVVTALDLPPNGGSAVMEAMRRLLEGANPGLVAGRFAASGRGAPGLAREGTQGSGGAGQNFQDCQIKFDREGMLESVARWQPLWPSRSHFSWKGPVSHGAGQRAILHLLRRRFVFWRGRSSGAGSVALPADDPCSASSAIEGLINLRGQIVTAIDMRRLRLAPRGGGQTPMNMVVRTDEGAVILLVDEIGDVLDVDETTYERPPENLDPAARELILGVYKLQDRLLLVLDAERTTELTARS